MERPCTIRIGLGIIALKKPWERKRANEVWIGVGVMWGRRNIIGIRRPNKVRIILGEGALHYTTAISRVAATAGRHRGALRALAGLVLFPITIQIQV
jgi:hypothetical protein